MTTVCRTFAVSPPPSTVVEYLRDFGHAEEWDPGTRRCTRLDSGPIRVGSRWRNQSRIAGISTELTYELSELTDDRIVLVGRNDRATSTDTITVRPQAGGSQVTYQAVIEMKGAAKLAAPLVKVVFEKLGRETEETLARALNALPST